jgi:hypothetical protein
MQNYLNLTTVEVLNTKLEVKFKLHDNGFLNFRI